MCTAFLAWKTDATHPLIVLSNRDEFHARPTEPAAWNAEDSVLGGVDLQAGGRWLGVSRDGKFATLLNVRDPLAIDPDATSRGELVDGFFLQDHSALQYAESLLASAGQYNPYNLLLCDGDELVFLSNHPAEPPRILAPGIYGISNGALDEPWPKVVSGKSAFPSLLDEWSVEDAFSLLSNRALAAPEQLPQTGVPLEWEQMLSALFIVSDHYGTRASTVLRQSKSEIEFYERSFNSLGKLTNEKHYRV